MMVAVSAERCQAICHPLRERPHPLYYIVFVIIISVSLNARKYFEFQSTSDGDYETTSIMEYPTYIMFSTIWQELILTGIVPFSTLIYYNAKIYAKIKESSVHEHYRYVGGHRKKHVMIEMHSHMLTMEYNAELSERDDIRNINKVKTYCTIGMRLERDIGY
nr:uncharacterized protein LOC121121660 [Lepeophtheirus salmonis]